MLEGKGCAMPHRTPVLSYQAGIVNLVAGAKCIAELGREKTGAQEETGSE
jgi:hypothetical protein